MNEQSYKILVLRKFHAFSRNQTPIIVYLSCLVGKDKQKGGWKTSAFLDTLKAKARRYQKG